MLTLFTVPKPFRGHIGLIQRNAIISWIHTFPGAQILLFGAEDGTEAVAAELGVEHVADIDYSRYGAPLLNSVFPKARERARHPVLCFVNSDIIFRASPPRLDLIDPPFLMIGESFEVTVGVLLPFHRAHWQRELEVESESRGPFALDYFIFNKDLFDAVPPFRIGRARYDNWLIWRALRAGGVVVDTTQALQATHQRHDYDHLHGGRREAYRGADARINEILAGPWCYLYLHGIHDACWTLGDGALQPRSQRLRFIDQWRRRIVGRVRDVGRGLVLRGSRTRS